MVLFNSSSLFSLHFLLSLSPLLFASLFPSSPLFYLPAFPSACFHLHLFFYLPFLDLFPILAFLASLKDASGIPLFPLSFLAPGSVFHASLHSFLVFIP
jgi:hypothetical protein